MQRIPVGNFTEAFKSDINGRLDRLLKAGEIFVNFKRRSELFGQIKTDQFIIIGGEFDEEDIARRVWFKHKETDDRMQVVYDRERDYWLVNIPLTGHPNMRAQFISLKGDNAR